MNPRNFFLLFSFVSFLDWATTAYAFSFLDGFHEGNLLSRVFLDSFGVFGLFLFKAVGVLIVSFLYWLLAESYPVETGFWKRSNKVARVSAIVFGIGLTGLVVLSNFWVIFSY